MSLHYRLLRLTYQFRRGIWTSGSVPFDREHWRIYLAQRLYMVFHGLLIKEHWMSAAQLTYNTLMAIIPVMAIVYAIANGFGFGDLIIDELRKALSSQPQIADALVSLSQNYIHYTHTGVVLGISFVFMLYSVLSLFNNIEAVFNRIWGTHDDRSIGRMVVDYTAMLFIVPIVIILFSGLSFFFYTILGYLPSFQLLTPFVKATLQFLLPLVILSMFFMALYLYIPNTNVHLRYVFIPSVLAAFCVMVLQIVFVHFQVLFTSYSIIYGSLAALPMLMLWLQLSWYIGIGFAELGHANQEIGRGNLYEDREESIDARLRDCTIILSILCQRQKRGAAPTTMKDLMDETHLNYRNLRRCIKMLSRARLIHANLSEKDDGKDVFLLKKDSSDIRLGDMTEALTHTPYTRTSSHAPWQLTSSVRKQIKEMRREYLHALNNIKVAESATKV